LEASRDASAAIDIDVESPRPESGSELTLDPESGSELTLDPESGSSKQPQQRLEGAGSRQTGQPFSSTSSFQSSLGNGIPSQSQ